MGALSPLKALRRAGHAAAAWCQKRPHSVTGPLPGTTKQYEYPPRTTLPAKPAEAPAAKDPVAHAEEVARLAQAMMKRLTDAPHGLNDRPGGPGTAWEKVLAHLPLPLLHPKPVPQLQTLAAMPPDHVPTPPKSLGAAEFENVKSRLLQDLESHSVAYRAARTEWQNISRTYGSCKKACEDLELRASLLTPLVEMEQEGAVAAKDRAKLLAQSPGLSPRQSETTGLRVRGEEAEARIRERREQISSVHVRLQAARSEEARTKADLEAAGARMMGAASKLRARVAATDLNDMSGAVLAAGLTVKHLDFVHTELGRLSAVMQQRIDQAQGEKEAFGPEFEQMVATHQLLQDGLQLAHAEQAVQQHTHASLESDLVVVSAHKEQVAQRLQVARHAAGVEDHAGMLAALQAEHNHFRELEASLTDLIAEAGTLVAAAEERVTQTLDQARHVLGQLDQLRKQSDAINAHAGGADQALTALELTRAVVAERQAPALETHTQMEVAAKEVEAAAVEVLLLHPPGFPASEPLRDLSHALRGTLRLLPNNPAADALPKKDVAEALSLSLAHVSGGDAKRALLLLKELRLRPTLSMVPNTEAVSTSRSPEPIPPDLKALFHYLAGKPRGIEVLQMAGANSGELLAGNSLVALRTYWEADGAAQGMRSASVAAWLGSAKEVAAERLHTRDDPDLERHLAERFGERKLAAYNAVRNGYRTNEPGSPYDQRNKDLLKVSEEWMARRLDRYSDGFFSGLAPTSGKTPFRPETLSATGRMADRFGIKTHAGQAARAIGSAARDLGELAADLLTHSPNPEERRFNLAVRALAQHVKQNLGPTLRALTERDFTTIRRRFNEALAAEGGAPTHGKQPLPDILEDAAAEARAAAKTSGRLLGLSRSGVGVSVEAVVRDVAEQFLQRNGAHLDAEAARKVVTGLGLDHPAVQENFRLSHISRHGQPQGVHLEGKEDLVRFYKPMFTEWSLRDKLKTAGGGTLGGGVPFLPYVSPKMVAPMFSAGYGHKREAFVQFFQPILGIEMMVGEAKTNTVDAIAGVAVGKSKGKHFFGGGYAFADWTRERMSMEGTVVRFLRARGKDDVQRQDLQTAWESTVMWKDLKSAHGDGNFSGPMEALLARSPDVVVTGFKGGAVANQVEIRGNGGFRVQTTPDHRGAEEAFGLTFNLKTKLQKSLEFRSEDRAAVYVVSDKASQAKQTFNASLDVQVPLARNTRSHPLETQPIGPDGQRRTVPGLGGGSVPLDVTFDRELGQHFQKHGLSPFRINDKQDGDLDRHYFGAKEMLAEISANREQWLARALETLPEVDGAKDTPENRAEAQRLLDEFAREIVELEKQGKYCQFNVNYSMRPHASARIDGARLVGELAAGLGNAERASERLRDVDAVLRQASTWRPLMLIVREKGKDALTLGLNYGLRAQSVTTIDGQRTAAQFPPP